MQNDRPHIIVNVAMTVDGKLDTIERKGAPISSRIDRQRVDQLRASVDAVMVGGRTLISENPSLTIRSQDLRLRRIAKGLEENPAKVAVISQANLDLGGAFMNAGPARRLIYTTKRTLPDQVHLLEKAGAQVFVTCDERIDLINVMQSLHDQGIQHLMVEGGGTLIASLFQSGLVDDLFAYIAPQIFSGASAPTLADGAGFKFEQAARLTLDSVNKLDDEGGILVQYSIHPIEKDPFVCL
jgi:2,5-diamino-6-(ribosylamino)-4(3H)-pyrimidinone 5'-phosphate reductase